jgi:hypothetical protein
MQGKVERNVENLQKTLDLILAAKMAIDSVASRASNEDRERLVGADQYLTEALLLVRDDEGQNAQQN